MPSLVDEAGHLLATQWGDPVRLRIHDVIRSWGRHTLLRCRVKQAPRLSPGFVVVKTVNQPEQQMLPERAGLELLSAIPQTRELIPEMYAAANTMLVLEDLGNAPMLSQLLRARAAWAEEGLLESMRGLATVHARTRGRYAEYAHLHAKYGSTIPGNDPTGNPLNVADLSAVLARALAAVGLDPDDIPSDELRYVVERMSPPADLTCLTFYDQCPSNRMMVNGRLRVVDLEMVAFRHPFLDAAYPLLGYLKCMDGLRLPDQLERQLMSTYRAGVADAYPELVDDGRFADEMTSACAVSVLWHLTKTSAAVDSDGVVGHFLIRRRQRLLAVLDAFLATATAYGALPRLTDVCRRLRSRLGDRWEGLVEPLPTFSIWRG